MTTTNPHPHPVLRRWPAALGLLAAVVLLVGLSGRADRGAQTAALIVYGGAATVATFLSPDLGLVVVGLTLAAHGVWDVVHLRRDAVVARSLAEACVWLDVPLGLGVLVFAASG